MLPKVQIFQQRIDRKGVFFQEMILLILDIIEFILSFSVTTGTFDWLFSINLGQ